MFVLALDTATDIATCAVVSGDDVLGERTSRASRILADADALLREAGAGRSAIEGVAVGVGPGSFTGIRLGLAAARGLAFALNVPVAGVSTLAALAAGAPGAVPVVDARRREVFALLDGEPVCLAPGELALPPGTTCVGDGARRYRALLEERALEIPPDDDPRHVPRARFHALLAREFVPAELVEPLYLRVPDAERARMPA